MGTLRIGKQYTLMAFIVHEGDSPHSGHYYTCVKRNATWYRLSDAKVIRIHTAPAL